MRQLNEELFLLISIKIGESEYEKKPSFLIDVRKELGDIIPFDVVMKVVEKFKCLNWMIYIQPYRDGNCGLMGVKSNDGSQRKT